MLLQNVEAIVLQNATEVYLQNVSDFLLQNATVITNCDDFFVKCYSYYKMWRLLKIATVRIL